MLTEISQTEKEKHYMILHICGIEKIQQTSDYNKKKKEVTDIENKFVVISEAGEVEYE